MQPTRTQQISSAGLAFALGGSCLWGLSFVIPLMLPGVSSWDIALGRYLSYGAIASLFVLRARAGGVRLGRGHWGTAFVFTATGYYGCYVALVAAIELAGPATATLVMGLTPVSVAMAANLRTREVPFSRLTGPVAVMGLGLALANLARPESASTGPHLWPGLGAAFAALTMLTWYLVANISFLKRHPEISPLAWSNVVGCALMAFSACALGIKLLSGAPLPWDSGQVPPGDYIVCSLMLGVGVSWLGGALWNKANALLPAPVAGQCTVFWPVSGILYACILQKRIPGMLEATGMILVFAAVAWGLSTVRSSRAQAQKNA